MTSSIRLHQKMVKIPSMRKKGFPSLEFGVWDDDKGTKTCLGGGGQGGKNLRLDVKP